MKVGMHVRKGIRRRSMVLVRLKSFSGKSYRLIKISYKIQVK